MLSILCNGKDIRNTVLNHLMRETLPEEECINFYYFVECELYYF